MSKKKAKTKKPTAKKAVKKVTNKGSKKKAAKKKATTKKVAKKRVAKRPVKSAKVPTRKTSPVKGKSVAWYIGTLEDWQQEIVREIDTIVQAAAPKATSSIKWAQPVYESDGPFAFMKAAKKHVTFGFWRGVELEQIQSQCSVSPTDWKKPLQS